MNFELNGLQNMPNHEKNTYTHPSYFITQNSGELFFFLSSVISIPEGPKISQKIPSAEENKPVLNGHTIVFPHIIKS